MAKVKEILPAVAIGGLLFLGYLILSKKEEIELPIIKPKPQKGVEATIEKIEIE